MTHKWSEIKRRTTPEAKERAAEDLCPLCGSDLKGEPIPPKHLHLYGGRTHFSRKLGRYDRDLDRTVAWACPDCGGQWPR